MTDSILFWNDVALEANRISHTNMKGEQTGPPLSARALAIVHLAMYDAYSATNLASGLAPYLAGLPAPPAGASSGSAVGGAAHTALSALFPSQKEFFDTKLGQAGDVLDPGHDFGVVVANLLLQDRAMDPSVGDAGYFPSKARGRHRVDPDNPRQGYHAPFYGQHCKLFAAQTRHTLDKPPFDDVAATKAEYEKALREVRGLGIAPDLMGTLPTAGPPPGVVPRTNDQTIIGIYWGYDGAIGLGTPPRLYNQIIRRLAMKRSPRGLSPNTEAENARLFALINVAMADAGILAWDEKYIHDFWRPVLGIREHDKSMGPGATAPKHNPSDDTDSGWLPLGAPATNSMNPQFAAMIAPTFPSNQSLSGRMKNFTPPFPAYPSGHATFGAAAFHIARLFYGVPAGDRNPDDLFKSLDFVSEELNGSNQDNNGTVRPRHLRNFPDGLWQMIIENGRSRVFLGVHWVFDAFAIKAGNPDLTRKIGGVRLGLDIAEDIFGSGMVRTGAAGPRP